MISSIYCEIDNPMGLDWIRLIVFSHLYHLCNNLLRYLESSVGISPAHLPPLHVVGHLGAITALSCVQPRPYCLVLTQRPVYPVLILPPRRHGVGGLPVLDDIHTDLLFLQRNTEKFQKPDKRLDRQTLPDR